MIQTDQTAPKNIDEYIAGFPPDVQEILEKVRLMIREAAPLADETIKYRIPTFTLKGNMLSFAAYKKHIGLYPVPSGTEKFRQELSPYKAAKSTARFPLGKSMPYALISELVRFRVKEHLDNAAAKAKKK